MMVERRHGNGHDGGLTKDPTLRRALAVLFLGSAALGSYFLIAPALSGELYYKVGFNRTAYQFAGETLPLFVPWAIALLAWRRGLRVPLKWLIGGAVILHLIVLFAPPAMSQDFYQYLFYGRMQAVHGANPYVVLPSHFYADPWFAWTRWHDQTSVYGPLWMLVTAGVAKTAGDSLVAAFVQLKIVILALDLAIMAFIVRAAKLGVAAADGDGAGRRNGGSDWERTAGFGLLAFAWNPLVLVSVPLAGAADVVLAAAFVGAVVARRRGWMWLATLLLTLAALTKVYAVAALALHLVLVGRERNWRAAAGHAAGALGLSALAYVPYWVGTATFNGLIQAAGYTNHSFVGAIQAVLVTVLRLVGVHPATPVAGLVLRILIAPVLVAVGVWALRQPRDDDTLWKSVVVILTAYLLLTPWYMYWYILGALALVAVQPRDRLTDPILTFSGTSMIALWWFPFALRLPETLLLVMQAALRYLPPVWVFRREQHGERSEELRSDTLHPEPRPDASKARVRIGR